MPTKKEEPTPIIAKITIQIGDVKAPVTLDQARKLHAALSEMFGVKEVERVVYRDNWSWPWARPYWQYNVGGLGSGSFYCGSNLNAANNLSHISTSLEEKALGIITDAEYTAKTPTAVMNTDYCLRIE